jgi:hypothetical protein
MKPPFFRRAIGFHCGADLPFVWLRAQTFKACSANQTKPAWKN